ncbi:hypothetical protein JZU71_00540, partial [bacterium]|nr:hypothetical protein [bacterium]
SMYLMSLFEDESEAFRRPSMGKAIHVSMQFSLGKKFGDGDKMHYSESKIRECWDEYKSVAHLWAAYRITQAYPLPGGEGNAAVKIGSIDFLKVAAGIYKFGVNFIPADIG